MYECAACGATGLVLRALPFHLKPPSSVVWRLFCDGPEPHEWVAIAGTVITISKEIGVRRA